MAAVTEPKSPNDQTGSHRWRFFRIGGFDQVRIENGSDIAALDTLDPKLWAALSCPASGLEFDARTLRFLDADEDGRIRVPEVLAAVRWVTSALKNAEDLTQGRGEVPLSALDETRPEGRQLLASARRILAYLGKEGASVITVEDVTDTEKLFSKNRFNGDGIVPQDAVEDTDTKKVVEEILEIAGSDTDRSGAPGISKTRVDRFFADAEAYSAWWRDAESRAALALPLGERTPAAVAVLDSVRAKVDDYFARCRLVEFDPRAVEPLNPTLKDYESLAAREVLAAGLELGRFPLGRVEARRPLPLADDVNPVWAGAMARFRAEVVEPLLGDKVALKEEEWTDLKKRLSPCQTWLAAKKGFSTEKLGLGRVREILEKGTREKIEALIEADKAVEPEVNAMALVEKLVLFHRDLFPFLKNFVSFSDFYSRKAKAVFQAGTLYLDGRSCDLCVRVSDTARHAPVAALSRTYLAYCDCTRKGTAQRMTIAAAFTCGDSDNLMVGRNGIFFDRRGEDWDAAIVRIVEHPISIGQAFLAPYKRVARMVAEQLEKMAAARDKAAQEKAAKGIADVGRTTESAPPAAGSSPAPFDVGKFAGIFAAIGLAVGAIGTAIASGLTGFMGLRWWQMPLAIVGLVLIISGPSMVVAWFKLRQRSLGPILDASGWAVNTRARINIAFGAALTSTARLPEQAERSLVDPYAEKKRPWLLYALILLLAFSAGLLWHRGIPQRWLELGGKQPAVVQTQGSPAPPQGTTP